MADIVVTASLVRCMNYERAIVNPYLAGAALTVGDVVYQTTATAPTVDKADANAGDPIQNAIGIVIESFDGETAVASGAMCTVLEFGQVTGFSSATPGSIAYVSSTAGKVSGTAPASTSFARLLGRFVNATTLMVSPVISVAASA